MQAVAGELGFLNIEHVWATSGKRLSPGFHHLQAVAVLLMIS